MLLPLREQISPMCLLCFIVVWYISRGFAINIILTYVYQIGIKLTFEFSTRQEGNCDKIYIVHLALIVGLNATVIRIKMLRLQTAVELSHLVSWGNTLILKENSIFSNYFKRTYFSYCCGKQESTAGFLRACKLIL
jgi:mannose/fructose/N-acetylgalactosamine-specific phosphotransferase system component IID